MGAHEQTSPSHESGGLDPKDLERTVEEEDIKDIGHTVNNLMFGVTAAFLLLKE